MILEDALNLGLSLAENHANGSSKVLLINPQEQKEVVNHSNYHPLYPRVTKLAEELAVHYLYDEDPGEMLTMRRPSEPGLLQQYRRDTYEQLTYSVASKIIGVIKGFLFNEELYRKEFPDSYSSSVPEGDSLDKYLENVPGIGNIFEYFANFVLQFAEVDPNGYFAVVPYDFDNEDLSKMPEPVPQYIPCDNIIDQHRDFVFVKSTAYTELSGGGEGHIFYLFTDNNTIRFEEIRRDSQSGSEFEAVLIEDHQRGEKQIRQIKGIVSTKRGESVLDRNNQIVYLSPLQATIPHFNSALKHRSDLEGAIVNHLYPPKYEMAIDCPTCQGTGNGPDGENQGCETCKGDTKVSLSEIKAGTGPYTGWTVDANDDGSIPVPAGYVTNSDVISAIQEAAKLIKEEYRAAYAAVNMEFVIDKTARQKTEKEVRDDSKLFESFLTTNTKTIFSLCQWILDAINYSRHYVVLDRNQERIDENRIRVIGPRSFDTTNPNAALERIIKAIEAKLDKSIIHELVKMAVPKLFDNDSNAGKKALAYANVDPFPMMTEDDILAMQSTGSELDEIDLGIKANLVQLVNEACLVNSDFINLNADDQREVIKQLAESRVNTVEDDA